jgi:hypothetical protein
LPTEKKWERCSESVPIPAGVMLPDYKVRTVITLPPAVVVSPGGEPEVPEPMSTDADPAQLALENGTASNQS